MKKKKNKKQKTNSAERGKNCENFHYDHISSTEHVYLSAYYIKKLTIITQITFLIEAYW